MRPCHSRRHIMTMRLATDLFECTWAFQQIRFVGFLSFGSTCSEVYRILETFEFAIRFDSIRGLKSFEITLKVESSTRNPLFEIMNLELIHKKFKFLPCAVVYNKIIYGTYKRWKWWWINFQWFTRSRYMG